MCPLDIIERKTYYKNSYIKKNQIIYIYENRGIEMKKKIEF